MKSPIGYSFLRSTALLVVALVLTLLTASQTMLEPIPSRTVQIAAAMATGTLYSVGNLQQERSKCCESRGGNCTAPCQAPCSSGGCDGANVGNSTYSVESPLFVLTFPCPAAAAPEGLVIDINTRPPIFTSA